MIGNICSCCARLDLQQLPSSPRPGWQAVVKSRSASRVGALLVPASRFEIGASLPNIAHRASQPPPADDSQTKMTIGSGMPICRELYSEGHVLHTLVCDVLSRMC